MQHTGWSVEHTATNTPATAATKTDTSPEGDDELAKRIGGLSLRAQKLSDVANTAIAQVPTKEGMKQVPFRFRQDPGNPPTRGRTKESGGNPGTPSDNGSESNSTSGIASASHTSSQIQLLKARLEQNAAKKKRLALEVQLAREEEETAAAAGARQPKTARSRTEHERNWLAALLHTHR